MGQQIQNFGAIPVHGRRGTSDLPIRSDPIRSDSGLQDTPSANDAYTHPATLDTVCGMQCWACG